MTPAIFFDLDGVLADFVRGALKLHGKTLPMHEVRWDFLTQVGFQGVNDPRFWAPMGCEFWANLDPLPDGFALLAEVERMLDPARIGLLTSAAGEPGCIDGKRDWVARHLPAYSRRLFTGSAKELFAAPSKLLIDDHDANCEKFKAAGGAVVTVPRPWNRRIGDTYRGCGGFDHLDIAGEVRDILSKM